MESCIFHRENENQQQDGRNVEPMGVHIHTFLYKKQNKPHTQKITIRMQTIIYLYFLLAGEPVIKISKKKIILSFFYFHHRNIQ